MIRRGVALLVAAAFVAAACSSSGSSSPPASTAPGASTAVTPIAGGLLEKVTKAGKLIVSTDANYAPQSVQKPDGSYEGFDIDVAAEIAKRLGVKVEFITPGWDIIAAGSWAGRWDVSVGSMTITVPRQAIFEFSPPYYFTPAQMTATTASGITTIDGLAGKTVCVGGTTTYEDWLKGTLQSVSLGTVATPPAGVKVQSLPTDQDCAQAIAAGRKDAEGYLTSSTTVDAGIKNGTPIIKIGDPVFTEQLAVAVDKSGPPTTDFMPALSKIITDMHADGTLKTLSEKWLGGDLTKPPS
jgi:polar amino acid transport system substrate-binding protein